ncbi:uncharacterized protein METZ01_LOCUS168424, partial [marine metagenome]
QQEFEALATSANAEVVASITSRRRSANPRFLVGKGKVDEIGQVVRQSRADLVLVDHNLTPRQELNLERALDCRVVDRAGLILDIFAQRARTSAGKLQVELAQLVHLSTRLVRGWTHLERQKGGIGLRGPGETQLETDRRLIGQRIKQLSRSLERLARHRGQARHYRRKRQVPTVSLVGYTNAGKSTLFNRLSGASVDVADKLFATVDPTVRKVCLPDDTRIVITDTVGFIREIPHELIAAFHSTLEETVDASLLLHVIDCAECQHKEHLSQVNEVLRRIGADHLPIIQVYNKADILAVPPRIDRAETGMPERVWVSARTGEGVESLLAAMAEFLHKERVRGTVRLKVSQAKLRGFLYDRGKVLAERAQNDGGWEMDIEMDRRRFAHLRRHEKFHFSSEIGGCETAAVQ